MSLDHGEEIGGRAAVGYAYETRALGGNDRKGPEAVLPGSGVRSRW